MQAHKPVVFVVDLLEVRFVFHTISFDAMKFKFMLLRLSSTRVGNDISYYVNLLRDKNQVWLQIIRLTAS